MNLEFGKAIFWTLWEEQNTTNQKKPCNLPKKYLTWNLNSQKKKRKSENEDIHIYMSVCKYIRSSKIFKM
jgi:hypothetical protein